MKLTNRMKAIASLVDKGVNVIDIGCDHALIDIYLSLYNGNKCIASDINENALSSAKTNIKKYNVDIETVLSNGFENIRIPKNSTVIICGMGSINIKSILLNSNLTNIDTIIIQSNTNLYILRKLLYEIGYYIYDEIVIFEKKIYYVIIKFKKGNKIINEDELEFGPILLKKDNKVIHNYYLKLLDTYNNIVKNSNDTAVKDKLNKKINFLNKTLK